MHPQLVADPKLRKRFEQEARVGARIESEHVVQVLAAGIDAASGAPWLVMELLAGEDLSEYIERVGCLAPGEVRALFEQLCHAVGAAHAAGIVHRDLKPENIFLAAAKRVGAPYVIKVLDFGIAKVASEAKTVDTAAIGTPIWMAPEQSSTGQPVSAATDVWALGLIAFRLLTGKPFWRSANDEQSNTMMLLREIVLDPIPRAGERATELACADRLVPGFDGWFARCVARDQGERFTDAAAAFAALEPLLPAKSLVSSEAGFAKAVARASSPRGASSDVAFEATHPASPSSSGRAFSEPQLAGSRTRSGPQHGVPPKRTTPLILGGGVAALVAVLGAGWLVSVSRRAAPSAAGISASPAPVPAPSAPPEAATPSASLVGSFTEPVPARMISIPGGAFSMGSNDGEDDERPVHTETVDPFDIDATEVTTAAYKACVAAGACTAPQPGTGCNWGVEARADHPINCVTWQDADTYCHAVRKRLPTEREWEYAARGKNGKKWPWGAVPPAGQLCWNGDGADVGRGNRKSTCSVSSFVHDVSVFGVLDMGGNVAEWTASRYCPYTAPNCATEARVTRGGAWDDLATPACGSTYRDKRSEFERTVKLGFRCARTP
jgi:formylglycine-generating enzyme required for sulfatase activity